MVTLVAKLSLPLLTACAAIVAAMLFPRAWESAWVLPGVAALGAGCCTVALVFRQLGWTSRIAWLSFLAALAPLSLMGTWVCVPGHFGIELGGVTALRPDASPRLLRLFDGAVLVVAAVLPWTAATAHSSRRQPHRALYLSLAITVGVTWIANLVALDAALLRFAVAWFSTTPPMMVLTETPPPSFAERLFGARVAAEPVLRFVSSLSAILLLLGAIQTSRDHHAEARPA